MLIIRFRFRLVGEFYLRRATFFRLSERCCPKAMISVSEIIASVLMTTADMKGEKK